MEAKLACRLFTIVLMFIHGRDAANILCLPTQMFSHMNEEAELVSELPKRGHNVYMLIYEGFNKRSAFETKGIQILEFPLSEEEREYTLNSKYFEEVITNSTFDLGGIDPRGPFAIPDEIAHRDCDIVLHNKKLLDNIRQIKFDIAVVDGFILNACWSILAYHLDLPVVESFTIVEDSISGVPLLPSYVPFNMAMMGQEMTFMQRVGNTLAFVLEDLIFIYLLKFENRNQHLLDEFADGKSLKDLRRNSMLHLITRDHLLEWPQPGLPHVVLLGSLTTGPAKPLDQHFQKIVDNSKHGIIVCTFGSMAGRFPKDITNKLASAFRRVKETVLWRFTGDRSIIDGEIPDNVIITKWMPQSDLLAQNKTKLFITHCGNNGQYEALYHGIPMIGMPLFAEQHHNAHRVVDKGFGRYLEIKTFTSDQLVEAINDVVGNPMYSYKTKRYSSIAKDARTTPREEAAYWIEHVIKFGGDHLRTYAINMPWYQYWLIDVFVFLTSVVFITLYILRRIFIVVW